MTAKKITPANPEARPATEADKGAETEPVDRKTAQIVATLGNGAVALQNARLYEMATGPFDQSRPWITPPTHFIAQAAMIPSGVPPMPSRRSMPVPARSRRSNSRPLSNRMPIALK